MQRIVRRMADDHMVQQLDPHELGRLAQLPRLCEAADYEK